MHVGGGGEPRSILGLVRELGEESAVTRTDDAKPEFAMKRSVDGEGGAGVDMVKTRCQPR